MLSLHHRFRHQPVRSRAVALATATTAAVLALSACSLGSHPNPSASTIVTDPQPTASASPEPAPTSLGGPAIMAVTSEVVVAQDLEVPWDIEVTADGSVLVSERDSVTIKRIRAGVATVLNGPGVEALREMVVPGGEGGLLGLAISAEHPEHLYAYVTRAKDNAVVRMELHDDLLGLPEVILAGIPKAKNHNGGRIGFGPDGFLYVATGDAQEPQSAQDVDGLAGKILRVIADGSAKDGKAAPGNPFDNRVWSWGHRNVQGFGWVADGRMYASELGQDSADELNHIVPGANYGWPTFEGMIGAPAGTAPGATVDGMTFPELTWLTDDASPSGVAVTNEGIYIAALAGERLWRVPLTATGVGEAHVLWSPGARVRDVSVAADGGLLAVTSESDGRGEPGDRADALVQLTIE